MPSSRSKGRDPFAGTTRSEPLAVRNLTWHHGRKRTRVTVRLWPPVRRGSGRLAHFAADYAIDGLEAPIRGFAPGADEFQCFELAMVAIRHELAPYRARLSFFGERSPSDHGFALPVRYDTVERLRHLEEVVEKEAERLVRADLADMFEAEARARAVYDPNDASDESTVTKRELLRRYRAAIARERTHERAGNAEAARVFSDKALRFMDELRMRPEFVSTLRALLRDPERSINLRAAVDLHRFDPAAATRTFERLASEGVEPEASEAREDLAYFREEAAHPRGFDPKPSAAKARPKSAPAARAVSRTRDAR